MAENSKIEWTDHTFNPWRGCVHKHARRRHAPPRLRTLLRRSDEQAQPRGTLGVWGEEGTRVLAAPKQWALVQKWNEAAAAAGRIDRVFCASLADVFEDWQGPIMAAGKQPVYLGKSGRASSGPHDRMTMDDARAKLFALIDATPHLFWLLLTKRPENVRRMWPDRVQHESEHYYCEEPTAEREGVHHCQPWYRKNVAIGTSVSDQATADELVPKLLACCDLAPVLFLSVEPLVGTVDLTRLEAPREINNVGGGLRFDALKNNDERFYSESAHVDWVIVGGESGHHARPMHPQWARDVRDQCVAAGVPFFFKQWGEWLPYMLAPEPEANPNRGAHDFGDGVYADRVGKHDAGRLLDGREWSELPAAFTPTEAAR